jgi:FkbM family methyltransferase
MDIEFRTLQVPELGREVVVAVAQGSADQYLDQFRGVFPFPNPFRFALADPASVGPLVDVGANIGQFSLPAGLLGIPTLAIEALPDNYVLLAEALARNALTGVVPLHLAASDRPQLLSFGGYSAWGQVVEEGATGTCVVPGLPLDDILPLAGFARPGLVKVDVEGHEHAVLRGLQRTLENVRPMLIVESNTYVQREEGAEVVLGFIERQGYRLFLFLPDGSATPRAARDVQEFCVADYLAVPLEGVPGAPLPVLRDLTADERVGLLETEAGSGAPHCWHVAHVVDRLPSIAGSAAAIDRVKAAVLRNAAGMRFIREGGEDLPRWLLDA